MKVKGYLQFEVRNRREVQKVTGYIHVEVRTRSVSHISPQSVEKAQLRVKAARISPKTQFNI